MLRIRHKQTLLPSSLLLVLVVFGMLFPSYAVEYTPIQLTDNEIRDHMNGVSNGYITWIFGNGDAREIFLYDSSTDGIIQITDNDYEDTIPQVHGGLVTWLGRPADGSDFEVFLYDHRTGITTRVTDNDLNENHPRVHEGLVVWYAWEGANVGAAEIYLYDSGSGITTKITSNIYADYFPSLHNGLVVWTSYRSGNGADIFLYDYTSGVTTRITNNDDHDDAPQIHEGLIAWRSRVDGIVKIFLYDTTTGVITYVDDIIYSYSFMLHDGKIAYTAPEDPDFEIYVYDYFDGSKTQITFNDYSDYSPRIYGDRVIWIDGGNIYLYDGTSGTTEQVTHLETLVYNAAITSGFIAWTGRGGIAGPDFEIFMVGLASDSNVDFQPNTLNLESKGRWVTVYIELPAGSELTASDIDVSTVLLDGQIPAELNLYTVGDYDADGTVDLMVKFDRSAVQAILSPGDEVTVTITGSFTDGSSFEGSDIIRAV